MSVSLIKKGFSEKNSNFFNNAKGNKFDAECDRKSKISRHAQNFDFSENNLVFQKKNIRFKFAKVSKIAENTTKKSKIFRNVQNLRFQKIVRFFEKKILAIF